MLPRARRGRHQPPVGSLTLVLEARNDGAGAFANDGTFSVYEISHPLNSGDVGHDFALSVGSTVGFFLFLRIIRAPEVFPQD
jgi:hypothetical protein